LWRPLVVSSDHNLVPIDDRPCDYAAARREQQYDDLGDLVGLAEFAHRHLLGGRGGPTVVGLMELLLGL